MRLYYKAVNYTIRIVIIGVIKAYQMEYIIDIILEFALPKSRISEKVRQNRDNAVYKSNMYFRHCFKTLKKLES